MRLRANYTWCGSKRLLHFAGPLQSLDSTVVNGAMLIPRRLVMAPVGLQALASDEVGSCQDGEHVRDSG